MLLTTVFLIITFKRVQLFQNIVIVNSRYWNRKELWVQS